MSNPDWMRFVLDHDPVPSLGRVPRNEREAMGQIALSRTRRVGEVAPYHKVRIVLRPHAPSYFEYMSRKASRS